MDSKLGMVFQINWILIHSAIIEAKWKIRMTLLAVRGSYHLDYSSIIVGINLYHKLLYLELSYNYPISYYIGKDLNHLLSSLVSLIASSSCNVLPVSELTYGA